MFTAPADHAVVEAVIKVQVIKVIKHFHTRLFPYSIILKYILILYYIYIFRSPRILNDLNDHDLNDRKRENFSFLFFYVK